MDWVAGFYPAGIAFFAILCQYSLSVSGNEDISTVIEPKAAKVPTQNENTETEPQEDDEAQDLHQRLPSQNHKQSHIIHSRRTVWFAAMWLSLQYYALLRMGSKIRLVGQEQEDFGWIALMALFLPTLVILISAAKLFEALERVESHQRLSGELKEQYYLTGGMVSLSFFLVLIPWYQAIWILIWS